MARKTKPTEQPKKKTPEPIIEQIDVLYHFSIVEIGELARKAALANQRVQELDERKKQQQAELKAQIDAAQAEVNLLSIKISNGSEMRLTDCLVTFDLKNESKDYHVKKTGEFVTRRQMDRRDFELSLPFEKLKEAAAAEATDNAGKENIGEALAKAEAEASPTDIMRTPDDWASDDGEVIVDARGWHGIWMKNFETPIYRGEYETRRSISVLRPIKTIPAEEATEPEAEAVPA